MPGNNTVKNAVKNAVKTVAQNRVLNRAGRAVGVPGWLLIVLALATLAAAGYGVWRWRRGRLSDAAAAVSSDDAAAAVITSAAEECASRGRFLGDDNMCYLPCQATIDDDGKPRERRCWIQPLGPGTPGVCVSKAYASRSGFECRDSPPIPAPKVSRSVSSVPLVPVPDLPDETACDGRTWAVIPGDKGGCCAPGFLWNKQAKMCCENANTSKNARCKKSDKEYVGAPGGLGPGWTWLGVKGSGPTAVHSWRSWDGIEKQRTASGKETITKAVFCYDLTTGKKVSTVGRACDKSLRGSTLNCSGPTPYLTFGKDKAQVCAPCPATPGSNWGWGYGIGADGKPLCTAPAPKPAAAITAAKSQTPTPAAALAVQTPPPLV
jgi:hypothetical protein